jgi:hypothetical protein
MLTTIKPDDRCATLGAWRGAIRRAAWALSLTALAVLFDRPLFAQTPTPTAQGTPAATPNFDDIDDPLNGQRVLANVVNLVVNNPGYSNNQTTEQNIVLATENGAISGATTQSILTVDCQTSSSGLPFPQQTRLVRLFNQANDVILTLAPTSAASGDNCAGTNNMAFHVVDTLNSAHDTTTTTTLGASLVQLGVGDFNQDGFDDVLVLNDAELFVVTAADINTPSSGLIIGSPTATGSTDGPLAEPAVGDFNDDGILDVAWITGPYSGSYNVQTTVNFASVCPGSVADTVCAGASALQVILNPLSSTPISLYYADGALALHVNAVAAGNFIGTAGADLMVAFLNGAPANEVTVNLYDFDGEMVPTLADAENLYPDDDSYLPLEVYGSATYVGFGGNAQAVFGFGGSYLASEGNTVGLSGVAVLSYNGSALTSHSYVKTGGDTSGVQGVAVGILGTPAGGFTSTADYAPDVALLIGNTLDIYSVNATTYAPTPITTYTLSAFLTPQNSSAPNSGGSWLRAGDLTGASVVVGDPEVLRVSDSSGANGQPQVVLSMPPQHVDYILGSGMTQTSILNFTTVDTYSSSYSTAVTSSSQSSNTSTTSYTHSVTTTNSETGKISFSPTSTLPDTVTQTTSMTYSNSISNTYNTYTSAAFDASTATTSTDLVWVTFQDYNIYNYPILGQTACPIDDSSCTSPDPLFFTISGPDDTFTTAISANTVEWYQPVQEPLQVFSYPCSESELIARLSSPSLLTTASPTAFYTDDSVETQSVSWTAGQGSEVTTGSSSTESFNTATTVTVGTPTLECTTDSADLTDELDYGDSTAFSTLYSSITMVGESTGFAIAKPGTFISDALYAYQVQPFIVGQTTPSGTVDTVSLDTDVQTSGAVQAMFVANPTATGSGSWWLGGSSYATDIDVAVNHPVRWTTAVYSEFTSGSLPAPCLSRGAAGEVWCAAFNYYNATDDLWDNEFYWMRGLLVTAGGLAGPQSTNATEGDTVYLQANIYNYSLTDMPSDDTIHVRFYSQEVDDNNNPVGDSVLLNSGGADFILDPLPAFASTTSTNPNYTTATINFSTSGLGDTYQIYWVVAWAEDGNGNLVGEVPGHGLSSLPGTLTAIGDVPLEMVTFTDTLNSDTVTTTTFSNNTGYLHQAFYIAAADSTDSATSGAVRARRASLNEQELHLSARASTETPQQHDTISVSGSLASSIARDGVVVLFYDGDPEHTVAFDAEVVPHLRAGVTHAVRVPYHARTCGGHDLTLIAAPGKSDEARASVHLDVRCDVPATPTATPGHAEDDGCAIGPRPASDTALFVWIAAVALLMVARVLTARSAGRGR